MPKRRELIELHASVIKKKMNKLTIGYNLLQKLRKLENEILSNDAYNVKNMETQLTKLRSAGADAQTIDLVTKAYDFKKKSQKSYLLN